MSLQLLVVAGSHRLPITLVNSSHHLPDLQAFGVERHVNRWHCLEACPNAVRQFLQPLVLVKDQALALGNRLRDLARGQRLIRLPQKIADHPVHLATGEHRFALEVAGNRLDVLPEAENIDQNPVDRVDIDLNLGTFTVSQTQIPHLAAPAGQQAVDGVVIVV